MNYKSIIEAAYNRKNWQELLHDIFASRIQFWATPSKVLTTNDTAQNAYYLAKITLADGKMIAVYEVQLADKVIIERNKVSIRNLLVQHWKNNGFAGAFMFCYKNNESILRFSYVSEVLAFNEDGKLATEATDTKRFTYYLGEGHRSRTAIDQFTKLKGSGQTLDDITKAFSIEAVSDAFFAGYKNIYEDIVEYMTGKRMTKVGNKWEEVTVCKSDSAIVKEFSVFDNPLKSMRDYVKKLMGRLVFLQFIQKKGWLGVKKNANWGTGDKEFMLNLFTNSKQKDDFIEMVLKPLFTDINTQRDGDLVSNKNVGTDIKVPFLNGGLFERDREDKTTIKLPAQYFERLFDFFSQYNFTIDENDPNDTEVGVDPEMLGRIFENLLEDNKDKGAFYTPKEIVRYMCRESLIAYLVDETKKKSNKNDEDFEGFIRDFVNHPYAVAARIKDKNATKQLEDIDASLRDVKICDPAIGSGAFPMGLLNELVACREAINTVLECDISRIELKKHIIQNNIYGVDIEKGAVDIARLRFWLSLVVDEDKPDALPNLDFKIMQGNSLLEQYCGVDLSNILQSDDMFVRAAAADLPEKLKQYYLTNSHNEKMELRAEITKIVENCIREANSSAPSIKVDGNNQFFLWHTWFKDVFDKGGFDIVIGNPPYIQLQNNGGELAKLYENCNYATFARTGDIYCLFYERGHQLLKQGGHLCYITSNKWMRAGYGEKTRDFFAMQTNPMLLIDFAGVKIFESATVDTNILLFAKDTNQHQTICAVTNKQNKDSVKNLSDFVRSHSSVCDFRGSDSWVILSEIEQSIKNKIEAIGTPLKDWDIQINYGIKTGFNDAFIISTEKRDDILANCKTDEERQRTADLIRPILRGRDIKRYGYDWAGLWLINTHNGVKGKYPPIDIKDYPAVKKHLDSYWDKIEKRDDKGVTPYNLRNCAYMDDFFKPKIVWASVGETSYSLVPKEYLLLDTNYFFAIDNPSELLAILNSKLITWWINSEDTQLGNGGAWRHYKYNLEKLHIPQNTNVFKEFIKNILHNISVKESILSIDRKVYALYNLTEQEIAFIENREP